jgi:hypothetical protein
MSVIDSFKEGLGLLVGLVVTVFAAVFAFRMTAKKEPVQKESDVESTVKTINHNNVKEAQAKQSTDEKIINITKDTNGKIEAIKETPVGDKVGLDDSTWNNSAGGVK